VNLIEKRVLVITYFRVIDRHCREKIKDTGGDAQNAGRRPGFGANFAKQLADVPGK
jgi:hypothetical protein